jgi:hypothetical protein
MSVFNIYKRLREGALIWNCRLYKPTHCVTTSKNPYAAISKIANMQIFAVGLVLPSCDKSQNIVVRESMI